MTHPLRALTHRSMVTVAEALESRRLSPTYSSFALQRLLPAPQAESVAAALTQLSSNPAALAAMLRLLAEERACAHQAQDQLELVWTGPEVDGAQSRDTAVVVRELFAHAQRSVLIAGFAVYQGREVFAALAQQMDANPALVVKMYLNVGRSSVQDTRPATEVLVSFSREFRERQWPGKRMPEAFYDPRSLELQGRERAALHAKCVVVDDAELLITSANFTEAAQQRNIEAGVLMRDPRMARSLSEQFESLAQRGLLLRVPGL